MGKQIRATNWSDTPLGHPKNWPNSLKTMVGVMLDNPFGMYIAWGKEYVQLYNDGYRPILGSTKHPQALGISTKETFSEIWEIIGPMFEGVMNGVPVGFPDFMLPLNRNGFVEKCYFDFSYSPIRKEDGEVGGVLVTVIETTNKRISEEKLIESEARFRAIADDAPIFLFLAGENAEVEYLNKTWQDYTGVYTEESKGRAWADITHPDDIEPATKIYMDGFNRRESCTFENRQKGTDGIYRTILWKATPRFAANGDFIGSMGVGLDIQDQKMAFEELELKNAQLIKINNDLDNFIYAASHDLKAPVSNIEGLLHALKEVFQEGNDKIRKECSTLLEMMETSITKFKHTILDLTDISKVQKLSDEGVEEINLEEMMEDVKMSISHEIKASKATITRDFSSALNLRFSKKNTRSILYNLLSNAIKYRDNSRDPEIHISTERLTNHILLIVRDNGLGIDENSKTKMFSMFKRFHNHVEGTGIGLYIVKRIIDNAGGKIEVESEKGIGSSFKVYFPVL